MAEQLARTRHLIGTTAEWAAVNPFIVASGEIAIEIKPDESRWIKIGDGVRSFANLDYISALNSNLATVAFSGAYSDLSGRPVLGDAAALNVGTSPGTVAAGNDPRWAAQSTAIADLAARLTGLQYANCIYRWGEVPVGSRSIGVPGGIGFGIADPALDLPQIERVRRLVQLILDAPPQLGGDLDVLTRKIFTSITNGDLVLEPNGTGRLKLDNHFFPIADASPTWALRTDGAGNLVFGAVDRWGLTPVGSETIGTPGGFGFGIADPLFTENQLIWLSNWLSNFLKPTQARVTDLETKVAVLYDLYLRELGLRNTGLTIGVAGAINFGVGPAATTGTPVGISEQDYYPVHANSDSLM